MTTADPSVAADSSVVAGWRPGAGAVDARILVVDNYDSFAYNLVQYVGAVAGAVTVRRNDAVDIADVRSSHQRRRRCRRRHSR